MTRRASDAEGRGRAARPRARCLPAASWRHANEKLLLNFKEAERERNASHVRMQARGGRDDLVREVRGKTKPGGKTKK